MNENIIDCDTSRRLLSLLIHSLFIHCNTSPSLLTTHDVEHDENHVFEAICAAFLTLQSVYEDIQTQLMMSMETLLWCIVRNLNLFNQ